MTRPYKRLFKIGETVFWQRQHRCEQVVIHSYGEEGNYFVTYVKPINLGHIDDTHHAVFEIKERDCVSAKKLCYNCGQVKDSKGVCPEYKEYKREPVLRQKVWTSFDGRIIPVSKMDTSHLFNTIRYIERRAWERAGFEFMTLDAKRREVDRQCFNDAKYMMLHDEFVRRLEHGQVTTLDLFRTNYCVDVKV